MEDGGWRMEDRGSRIEDRRLKIALRTMTGADNRFGYSEAPTKKHRTENRIRDSIFCSMFFFGLPKRLLKFNYANLDPRSSILDPRFFSGQPDFQLVLMHFSVRFDLV